MSFNLSPFELALTSIYTFSAMQKPEELAPLIELVVAKEPRIIAEIGFGKGGTSWAWSKIPSLEHLIIIDLPSGPYGGSESEEVQKKLSFISQLTKAKVTYIAGNSANSECLEKAQEALDKKLIDFLYIDGNHTYDGVKSDFLIYKDLVTPGGLIGFHDVAFHAPESGCDVKRFWDEVKESGIPKDKFSEFILPTEPSWGGNGVIEW